MTRLQAIESMYHYESYTEDHAIVDDETQEIIYNWYIEGFPKLESLRVKYDIEDLYDLDIHYKVYIKDRYIPEGKYSPIKHYLLKDFEAEDMQVDKEQKRTFEKFVDQNVYLAETELKQNRRIKILEKQNIQLKVEIEELKKLLSENHIEFGDMYYASDRGNEMRYE